MILGFHGTDKRVVEKVLKGEILLEQSENSYDWLGHGIYFWENNPTRALEFAKELQNHPRKKQAIKEPAVIGAVLNLGHCLDLLDSANLQILKSAYNILYKAYNKEVYNKRKLPENRGEGQSKDLLQRELDCAVIQTIHDVYDEHEVQAIYNAGTDTDKVHFDSVRGVFWEGEELYPNAGFREKDHIQICIRNPNCIKGFFLPRELNPNFNKV